MHSYKLMTSVFFFVRYAAKVVAVGICFVDMSDSRGFFPLQALVSMLLSVQTRKRNMSLVL